jgi:hypothetical protein
MLGCDKALVSAVPIVMDSPLSASPGSPPPPSPAGSISTLSKLSSRPEHNEPQSGSLCAVEGPAFSTRGGTGKREQTGRSRGRLPQVTRGCPTHRALCDVWCVRLSSSMAGRILSRGGTVSVPNPSSFNSDLARWYRLPHIRKERECVGHPAVSVVGYSVG